MWATTKYDTPPNPSRTILLTASESHCELFEKGCKTDHNPGYTLEHVLNSGAKPTSSDLKFKIDGNVGTLEYWEFGGVGDLIVTLSYRFAGGKWCLHNIHYV